MNQKAVSQGGTMDTVKWATVLALIVLAVAGNYHFSDQSALLRFVVIALMALAAMVVALNTEKGKIFWRFASDARNELRKVVWPTRQEAAQMTLMVLGIVAIIALILWGIDLLLLKIIAKLTGYGAH